MPRDTVDNREAPEDLRVLRHQAWEWERRHLVRSSPEALARAIACWTTIARDERWSALPTDFRLSVHNGRSNAHLRRYQATGDPADLEASLGAMRGALELLSGDHPKRSGYLHNMGIAIVFKFERFGTPELLDRAIGWFERAVVEAEPDSSDVLQFMSSLGGALKNRYELGGDRADLERAIELLGQALARTPESSTVRHHALAGLGLGLRTRFLDQGSPDDLDRAVRCFEEAVGSTPPSGPYLSSRLDHLGAILGLRYDAQGDLDDLEQSVHAFQRAIQASPPKATTLPDLWSNLGLSLMKLHERTRDPSHLDAAIEALEGAVRRSTLTGPSAPWHLLGLANGRLQRYAASRVDEDLDRAFGLLETVLHHTPRGSSIRSPALSALSLAALRRFERTRDLEDLETAVEKGREATEVDPGDPLRPKYLSHLANVYYTSHEERGRREDLDRAVESYRRAVDDALRATPEVALLSARFWGDWASRRRSWDEAAEAYDVAFRALTRLLQPQGARAARETWLREIQGLTGRAAYALSRNGQPERAVSVLEQGNGRLLAEVSGSRRAVIDTLQLASPELHERYLRLSERLFLLEQQAMARGSMISNGRDLVADIRSRQADLDDTLDEIRRLEGFDRFLEAPTLDDVQAVLRRSPGRPAAVYVLSTLEGSLALIVTCSTIHEVWLDVGFAEIEDEWTRSRERLTDVPELSEQVPENLKSLLGLLPFLNERFLTPVTRKLRRLEVDSVVLVPIGLLSSLPLHAGLLDDWPIGMVPNLTSLDAAQQELGRRTADACLLAVADPQPHAAPLASARAEVEWICKLFQPTSASSLYGEAATREVVLESLPAATHLHLACHGTFDREDPLESRLELGSDSSLRLRDVMLGEARPRLVRLAVLSACESAVPDDHFLPDEIVGLPAGFLYAGVPTVIGSLWPVDDPSTVLFMHRFYSLLVGPPPNSPAQALREAQLWLREVTVEELMERFRSFRSAGTSEALGRWSAREASRYFKEPATKKPFSHPYYWEPFVLMGVL